MDYPIEGFDESTYLEMNPDVLKAVQNRFFDSGWDHYLAHGIYENRSGVAGKVKVAVEAKISELLNDKSFPPEHLRKRVHGDNKLFGFIRLGKKISNDLHSAFNLYIKFNERLRVLDFGCGCGRVVRCLNELAGKPRYFGTDIDNEAIAWCKEYLPSICEFNKNDFLPSLPFKDNFFDVVYSISVFTHLPEDMQFAWLNELKRVTKRGGYLFLTIHGKDLLTKAPIETIKRFQDYGFIYSVGTGTEGLPDFYQTSFHAEKYIYKFWSRYFKVKQIIPKGIANHQDLVICQKPTLMSLLKGGR